MRVLVVEDADKLAGLIARALREGGLSVDIASTGEDALWMAGSTSYDAIVLDVGLPGMDGLEVCRRGCARSRAAAAAASGRRCSWRRGWARPGRAPGAARG